MKARDASCDDGTQTMEDTRQFMYSQGDVLARIKELMDACRKFGPNVIYHE